MSQHKKIIVIPLVLFSIADHYKRKRAEYEGKKVRVIGAIFGIQDQHQIKATLACPLRVGQNEATDLLDKNLFNQTLATTTDLIKTDHPGNHLANLQLIGLYRAGTQGLDLTKEDKELCEIITTKFENARYLIMNPEETTQEKSLRIWLKNDRKEMQSATFDLTIQKSETICMQSITTSGKEAPYLKTLIALKNVTLNYNELLKKLKGQKDSIDKDPNKLRQLNTILNSLNYISDDRKVLKNLDSSVVESLAACMYIDEVKRAARSDY